MLRKHEKALKSLRDPSCTACPLSRGASTVCVMGSGSYRLPIMVLGEAPGRSEDSGGKPFIGRAGMLLRAELTRAGLNPNSLYITNTAKCFPEGTPTNSEAKTCSNLYLRKEVSVLDPVWILALGRVAMEATTLNKSIEEAAGKVYPLVFKGSNAMVFPTYHPAFILRKNSKLGVWREHLETFAAFSLLDCGREVRLSSGVGRGTA